MSYSNHAQLSLGIWPVDVKTVTTIETHRAVQMARRRVLNRTSAGENAFVTRHAR